eukprot:m.528759 g.528759  ORF g.528759 m.528759 type:complete len:266 (+) comp22015_c0_seq72:1519-2316(+)
MRWESHSSARWAQTHTHTRIQLAHTHIHSHTHPHLAVGAQCHRSNCHMRPCHVTPSRHTFDQHAAAFGLGVRASGCPRPRPFCRVALDFLVQHPGPVACVPRGMDGVCTTWYGHMHVSNTAGYRGICVTQHVATEVKVCCWGRGHRAYIVEPDAVWTPRVAAFAGPFPLPRRDDLILRIFFSSNFSSRPASASTTKRETTPFAPLRVVPQGWSLTLDNASQSAQPDHYRVCHKHQQHGVSELFALLASRSPRVVVLQRRHTFCDQ